MLIKQEGWIVYDRVRRVPMINLFDTKDKCHVRSMKIFETEKMCKDYIFDFYNLPAINDFYEPQKIEWEYKFE